MTDSEIKIFYSWQSDLPGSQTRYLIQDSIDSVVKAMRNTVEIIADRDTKGEFGSPDITQTIFSKIDDSDIFIADISVINKYCSIDEDGNPTSDIKMAPNPNVLLELGYAAQALGWENVICIINTDFGIVDDLPFDIGHRRLTPYSLKDKSKSEVKKELREIIAATIINVLENGKRPKGSMANYIVGSYDFEVKTIVKQSIPVIISESHWYEQERKLILDKCKTLVETINSIDLPQPEEGLTPDIVENESPNNEDITNTNSIKFLPIKNDYFQKFIASPHLVKIKDDDIKSIKQYSKMWLDIDLSDSFFYLGELKIKTTLLLGQSSEYLGTDTEKRKHEKIQELDYYFHRIWLLDMYIKTFNGMCLFPLAVQNSSSFADRDISITVVVDNETADVILPSAKLINTELVGFEGFIYEDRILKNLLLMPSNSDIQYDTDISYDISDSISQIRKTPILGLGSSYPEYDSDDYEREIRKYIAEPIEGTTNEFDFYIRSLRPKEKNWLGAAILVKAKTDKVKLSYSIKSQKTDGTISGVLE